MSALNEFHRISNLHKAWSWIKSNPDASYKSYCGPAYSRFAIADKDLLEQLRDELIREIYQPTNATKIFLPKKSGILRPYSILSVTDQVVYQGMVNVVAERLAPRVRSQYLHVFFGHMYSGRSNKWFYKPWKKGYSAFNTAARDAFARGLRFSASFDLTAFYDSLDYGVLEHFLKKLDCDDEFCIRLKECLKVWTATETRIYHSHGIPQGPLSSGLLSEVVLRHFDLNFGEHSNVRYLRYVDDIRLFASTEDAVRRTLVRLDMLSKDVGLFPQSAKINIHEVEDIEEELKSISSPYEEYEHGEAEDDEDERLDQNGLRREIISLTHRSSVEDDTRFKFLLARTDPSSQLNTRLLRVTIKRPDLVPQVMRYLRKYDRLPTSVTRDLISRLRSEPLYENTTSEIITTLDGRIDPTFHRRFKANLRRLWSRRSIGPELRCAVGRPIFRERLLPETRIRYSLGAIRDWWVRMELISLLSPTAFGTIFLSNVLNQSIRDEASDTALSAAARLAHIGLEVSRPVSDLNSCAAKALRQLGMISRLPRGIDGVERSLRNLIGVPTGVNWRAVFRRSYKRAEKQAVFCRAWGDTDATAFVNAADVFDDLLLDRLYKHDPSLGTYSLGTIGSILSSPRLSTGYPAIFGLILEIHEKRLISSLSHCRCKKNRQAYGPDQIQIHE